MPMRRKYLITLIVLFTSFNIFAQYNMTEFIFEYNGNGITLQQEYFNPSGRSDSVIKVKALNRLSIHFDIYMISVPAADSLYWLQRLQSDPAISSVTPNVRLEKRNIPNDTRVSEQWHLPVIKAFEAWNITTGGKDFSGRDVVVAVLDDGFDLEHEDLKANYWVNQFEIPNDGIDNDNNGYVDDFKGWNTRSKNDVIEQRSHGTNVVGVLGAKGNNSKGIAGVNWDIKMMPVAIGTFLSDIIIGFDYVLTLRKRFNATNGTSGAFVVATSYSGGLPNAFAKDYPIWCGMYDKLGAEGIINIGATTNEDVDVEIVGDMPSTCESAYLIVVTSTDRTDEKEKVVGYGAKSVDLAAPGERILTTDTSVRGLYRTESGTSLSTPMVAGAVALLYASKCEPLYLLSKNSPAQAALKVKEVILGSTDFRPSLSGKTVTGGRLNIYNALVKLATDYNGCIAIPSPRGKLTIQSINAVNGRLYIEYLSPDEKEINVSVMDYSGRLLFKEVISPPAFGLKYLELTYDPDVPGIYILNLQSGNESVSKGFNVIIGKN
jgi:subtilisin family serine protease